MQEVELSRRGIRRMVGCSAGMLGEWNLNGTGRKALQLVDSQQSSYLEDRNEERTLNLIIRRAWYILRV